MIRTAFSGYLLTQCLYIAAKLDIASVLDKNETTSTTNLARITDTDAQSLSRILGCLSKYGIFEEDETGNFFLNEQARLLQDPYLRSYIIFSGEEAYQAAGKLLDCVRTGSPGFPMVFGLTHWEYLSAHPEKAMIFHKGMTKDAFEIVNILQQNYDLLPYQKIIDVGGGSGHIIGGILERYPDKEGIIYDLESVRTIAEEKINMLELANRLHFVGGSFFDEVPKGGGLYLMKVILHDWNDEQAKIILKNCANAMHQNSKLIIIDRVMDCNEQHRLNTAFVDILMLCMIGGRERKLEEFKDLLEESGLKFLKVYAENYPLNIIEAEKC